MLKVSKEQGGCEVLIIVSQVAFIFISSLFSCAWEQAHSGKVNRE